MIFAVHLSDGVVATPWLLAGDAGAIVLVLIALWRLPEAEVPRIGVLTAAFFVGSAIHVPTGIASVHLLLNGLAGVLLGRRVGLAVAVGMAMQFFLLAHGGATTLGLNICIVGVPALIGGMLFPVVRRIGLPPFAAGFMLGAGTAAATVLGDYFVLVLGGKEDWFLLARLVLLANTPVVVIEALIVGIVVQYLAKVRPEMLKPRVKTVISSPSPTTNSTLQQTQTPDS